MNLVQATAVLDGQKMEELLEPEDNTINHLVLFKDKWVTPLHIAVRAKIDRRSKYPLIAYLLVHGANPYKLEWFKKNPKKAGRSPMEIAKKRGYKKIVAKMQEFAQFYNHKHQSRPRPKAYAACCCIIV